MFADPPRRFAGGGIERAALYAFPVANESRPNALIPP
jgi:hypothetical protein